jgi:hypothetical protein
LLKRIKNLNFVDLLLMDRRTRAGVDRLQWDDRRNQERKMAEPFKVGSRVIAQKAPGGGWLDATILLVVPNGRFVVCFEDGFTCSLAPEEIEGKEETTPELSGARLLSRSR